MTTEFYLKTQETIKLMTSYLGQRHILVIDPSSNYRISIRQFLLNLRIKNVVCVSSVKEARKAMLTTKVGFIIAEWLGEPENGLQFCRELQQTPSYADIPFILMTSEKLRQDVVLASEVGVDGYLLKPFSYEDFINKVSVVIRRAHQPSTITTWVERGWAALADKNIEEAASFFKDALAFVPNSARALTGLAECHAALNETAAAITYLRQALAANPDFITARRLLLRAYEGQKDLAGMMQEAQNLHQQSPDNPRYTLLLATLYMQQKKLNEAEHYFKRTIKLSPVLAESYRGLGNVALERREHEKAARMFKKALNLDKHDVATLNALGLAYIRLGMFDEGVHKYRIALGLSPDDARIYYNLGHAYERQDDLSKARTYYAKAAQLQVAYDKALEALQRLRKKEMARMGVSPPRSSVHAA